MSDTDPKPDEKAPDPKPVQDLKVVKPVPDPKKPAADPKALELAKPEAKEAVPGPTAPAAEPGKAAAKPGRPPISPRNKVIFGLSILGVLAGLIGAYLFGIQRKPQSPAFPPISSPYASAIYADGIIESDQSNGSNINVYPEVSGPITSVLVHEGQQVSAGTVLLTIDDSIQKAVTLQLRLQSDAAVALLDELKAEPRMETLAIAGAQVGLAEAVLRTSADQRDKDRASFAIDPKSISRDVLDTAGRGSAGSGPEAI